MADDGNYDDELTVVRERCKARGAVLIVFDGMRGGGFSIQTPADVLGKLPPMLRTMAIEIEGETLMRNLMVSPHRKDEA